MGVKTKQINNRSYVVFVDGVKEGVLVHVGANYWTALMFNDDKLIGNSKRDVLYQIEMNQTRSAS